MFAACLAVRQAQIVTAKQALNMFKINRFPNNCAREGQKYKNESGYVGKCAYQMYILNLFLVHFENHHTVPTQKTIQSYEMQCQAMLRPRMIRKDKSY